MVSFEGELGFDGVGASRHEFELRDFGEVPGKELLGEGLVVHDDAGVFFHAFFRFKRSVALNICPSLFISI